MDVLTIQKVPTTSMRKYRYCFALTRKNGDNKVEIKFVNTIQRRILPKLTCRRGVNLVELVNVYKKRIASNALWTVRFGSPSGRLTLMESGSNTNKKNARPSPLRQSFLY